MKTFHAALLALGLLLGCSDDRTLLETLMPSYRPTSTLLLNWHDGGPSQGTALPIPIKQDGRMVLAALQIDYPTVIGKPGQDPQDLAKEYRRVRNEVSTPWQVAFLDPVTGKLTGKKVYMNAPERLARYHLVDPPGGTVGYFDDPTRLPKERLDVVIARVQAALDVLLPFFADEDRLSTDEAKKAAQEVRDFFPLAAEPGLWPYYKAEGREFFAWVEKNAPPGKATLPWEVPGAASSGR